MVKNNDTIRPSSDSEISPTDMQTVLNLFRHFAAKAFQIFQIRIYSAKDQLAVLLELQHSYDDTATPIRRIPDEVLAAILYQADPRLEIVNDFSVLSPHKIHGFWDERMQFLLVCQRRTHIIQDLPSFWSQTIIAPWFPQFLTERSIELSKLHFLDVHLFWSDRCRRLHN
ncbi:hypothetical protein M422DRAFT_779962 [Sphaerobolus stellatus SS14]|uniref:Uncharacterized protein n=1 Tax=Sphaerobolus stellatus (strain SS14) TaxID=990650 RepID=A0A0C9V6A6_SPHS4|nr:hypothetical protein M422DRAFT_779962 [Sphaerobolus stellatus SS14]